MRGADRGGRAWICRYSMCCAIMVASLLFWNSPLEADSSASTPPTIHAGAIEMGLAGAMTTSEGIANGSIGVHTGMFFDAAGGLLFGEVGGTYRHISSLDVLDLEANLGWQTRVGTGGNYPYVSVGAGVRREDIGSFGQTRYPLGFALGLRAVLGQWVGLRFEYRFRRILNDPVSNFSEHQLTLGVSVFFRNVMQEPQRSDSQ